MFLLFAMRLTVVSLRQTWLSGLLMQMRVVALCFDKV